MAKLRKLGPGVGCTALLAPRCLTLVVAPNLPAPPRVSVGLGWALRSGQWSQQQAHPLPSPPTALGLQGGHHHLSAGVLSTFCKVERPLLSGPLEPRKLLLQGRKEWRWQGKGRFSGPGVGEHLCSWTEQTSCTGTFLLPSLVLALLQIPQWPPRNSK